MLIGMGDITTLANAIQRVEGYIAPNAQYPNVSLAYQNNNPGNLRFANQPGATKACTQTNGCFAKFPTYDAGYTALENQIQLQADQGQTLSQFINQYAPPADGNNTSAYLQTLMNATGASADTPLTNVIGGATLSASTGRGGDSTITSGTSDLSSIDLSSFDPSVIVANAMGGDPMSIAIVAGTALLGAWLLFRRKA
jgi:hypothetical protein